MHIEKPKMVNGLTVCLMVSNSEMTQFMFRLNLRLSQNNKQLKGFHDEVKLQHSDGYKLSMPKFAARISCVMFLSQSFCPVTKIRKKTWNPHSAKLSL